jgi:hypothetical protein
MLKKLLMLLAIPAMLVLAGCNNNVVSEHTVRLAKYDAKASYFDGQVAVEYRQNRNSTNDFVSITMYQVGTYKVEFSYPPDSNQSGGDMLSSFTTTATGPRELVIQQLRIPNYLRVTITKEDGTVEFHDFS